MKNRGLVAKVLIVTCALLAVLMSVGCALFLKLERDMLRDMTDGYRANILESIAEQARAETDALHANVRFNAEVLSEIAAVHVYNYDAEGIRQNLQTFLRYPDIVAIEIGDDFGDPFAAAWQAQPDADELPMTLPDDFQRDAYDSVRVDAGQAGENRGYCLIYYSDQRLQANLEAVRAAGEQEAAAFHEATFARFYRELVSQIGIVAVVLILTLVGLAVMVRIQIIRPVLQSVDFATALANGDFTPQLTTHQHDEIGMLVRSLNDMRTSIVGVLEGMNALISAAQQGRLSTRGTTGGLSGDWSQLMDGMNSLMEAVVTPVRVTAAHIEHIANGRIPTQVTDDFQGDFSMICENLNRLAQTLHDMVSQIRAGTTVVLNSAQELTESSQQIASTSNQQAAAVKDIVGAMEDSDELAKRITHTIGDVAAMTASTKDAVTEGFAVIHDSLTKMDEIKAANAETIAEVKTLSSRIASIWDIVNLITDIADQTKIIAFNAELEASSAGEAGKNFRIVASEIRRLADSTVKATTQIKTRIQDVQKSSDRLIMSSEDDAVKIAEGWDLSQNLQTLFQHVRESADGSAGAADRIAQSISRQTEAFERILQTLKQISEGIEQFAASTAATTDAAISLKDMANILHAVIEDFVGPEEEAIDEKRRTPGAH